MRKRYVVLAGAAMLAIAVTLPALGGPNSNTSRSGGSALKVAKRANQKADKAQKTADSATTSASTAQATADKALAQAASAQTSAGSPTGAYSPGFITFLQNSLAAFRFHNPTSATVHVHVEMANTTGGIAINPGSSEDFDVAAGQGAVIGYTCPGAGTCSGTPVISVGAESDIVLSGLYTDAQGFRIPLHAGDFTRVR